MKGCCVCNGAVLQCSFGAAPSKLNITPEKKVNTMGMPAANIMDFVPFKNIMPFGMCNSISNPQVAAATSAALGVLTPMPCIPNIVAPWAKQGPCACMLNHFPMVNENDMLTCLWGGVIKVNFPGQKLVEIG